MQNDLRAHARVTMCKVGHLRCDNGPDAVLRHWFAHPAGMAEDYVARQFFLQSWFDYRVRKRADPSVHTVSTHAVLNDTRHDTIGMCNAFPGGWGKSQHLT